MDKGGLTALYSAIWKDGQLRYDRNTETYVKSSPNQEVALKCLHNSQNISDKFLNEVWNLYKFKLKFLKT